MCKAGVRLLVKIINTRSRMHTFEMSNVKEKATIVESSSRMARWENPALAPHAP